MVSSAIFLLVFVAGLQLDLVLSDPKITYDQKQYPDEDTILNTLTYKAEKEVRLNCSDGVKWDPIKIEKGNPVFKDAKVTNKTWVGVKKTDLGLVLQYDVTHFISQVKVVCKGSNIYDDITIEQKYPTRNVKILNVNQAVEGGQEVTLKCVADGNPEPEYQWYNKTETGFEKVDDGDNDNVDIYTPKKFNTTSLYQCRARNELNTKGEWMNSSNLLSVFSRDVPTPTIVLISPTPIKNGSIDRLFMYEEAEKITINCSLPTSTPADIKLNMTVTQTEPIDYPNLVKSSSKENGLNSMTMEITYNKLHFAQEVLVICKCIVAGNDSKSLDHIFIEQKYGVQNAAIDGPSTEVDPGTKVVLKCIAFGNPDPEYQWYSKSNKIKGANEASYEFMVPNKQIFEGEYVCGAKNGYNKDYIKSKPFKVSSTYAPPSVPPIITPVTPYKSKESNKFTYAKANKVTIRCSLPSSAPAGIELDTDIEQISPPEPILFKSTSKRIGRNIELEIQYDSSHFARLLRVFCTAKNKDLDYKSSFIELEQEISDVTPITTSPKASPITQTPTPGSAAMYSSSWVVTIAAILTILLHRTI